MKRYRLIWTLIYIIVPIIILIFISFGTSHSNTSLSLPDYIIGRWTFSWDQKLPGSSLTEIEFIKPDRLIINMNTKSGEVHNLTYKYLFKDDHEIKVEGRGGDEWLLNRQGGRLKIITTSFPNTHEYLFTRKPSINWVVITILISLLVIGSFYIRLPKIMNFHIRRDSLMLPKVHFRNNKLRILNLLFSLFLFGFGAMIGTFLWYCPILLNVLLPWDAVITSEFSFILLVLGIRTMRINDKEQTSINYFNINIGQYLGFFICGIGFWGAIMSLGKILLFSITGSYPQ